jgi:hypothetical protein
MPECGDAMSNRTRRLTMLARFGEVLQSLPRMLVSGQMILFSLLLGNAMGVRRAIV